MKKNILWLASFPKSGNTWLRLFLANYLFDRAEPVPLEQASRIAPSDALARPYAQHAFGRLDAEDHEAVLKLRPRVLEAMTANGADVNFVKTHHRNDAAFGFPLIPPDATRGALYVLRHPFDVAVSYAHHFACGLDMAVESLCSEDTVTRSPDGTIVAQYLGSWTTHLQTWRREKRFPVHVMRYEDMKADPERTFGGALRFVGAPLDPKRLAKAVDFSSFERTRAQEEAGGFGEKPAHAERFFRSGRSGEGAETLSDDHKAKIVRAHGAAMKRHGYL